MLVKTAVLSPDSQLAPFKIYIFMDMHTFLSVQSHLDVPLLYGEY